MAQPVFSISDPDDVKAVVDFEYPHLVSRRRRGPDGWEFHVRGRQGPSESTRIAQAVQRRPGAPVLLEPAVSARLRGNRKLEPRIVGGADQVRALLDAEIALWEEHFAGRTRPPHGRPADLPGGTEPHRLRRVEMSLGAIAFLFVAYLILTTLF